MHLKACLTRLWKHSCSLDIHKRENGYFFPLNFPLNLETMPKVIRVYKLGPGYLMIV